MQLLTRLRRLLQTFVIASFYLYLPSLDRALAYMHIGSWTRPLTASVGKRLQRLLKARLHELDSGQDRNVPQTLPASSESQERAISKILTRSEEHTSELQSHSFI